MKYAICNETYQGWTFQDTCDHIARCGYQGVEVAPFTLCDDPSELSERQAAEFGQIAKAAGLEVTGFHWLLVKPEGMSLTTPDDVVRARTVEFVSGLSRACAAMGGRVMVWGSPKQRSIEEGWEYEDAFARAVDVMRQLAGAAGDAGVTIAMEPLSTAETNFLTTAAETVRLIEAVDHPACRLHLDVKAMSSETTPIPEIIRQNAKHLAYFHANDSNLRGPGFGEVDFGPIAEALREVGYDGWLSVEVFDYSPDPETIAEKSLAYLKRHFGG